MKSDELCIGLLGASRVATYAILEPARALPGVRVHGVAARDPERAKRYAAEHGINRAYASYQDLLDDPEIGLVYVGTPPAYHVPQALAAIAAGKATLVEKPFALDAADARRLFNAAREAGVPIFEAMHSPHHALFARLLALLAQGRIGKVRHVEAVFDAPIPLDDPIRWSAVLGGGALMDLGVYPLAWVRRICGEDFIVEIAEAELRGDVDASFSARLRFEGGATAIVSSSMTSDRPTARLHLQGERGHIIVNNPLAPQLGHTLTITVNGISETETLDGPSTYEAQLASVRAAVFGRGRYRFAADDFVRSMEAIDRVRAVWTLKAALDAIPVDARCLGANANQA